MHINDHNPQVWQSSVSYRGWGTWDFPLLSLSFPLKLCWRLPYTCITFSSQKHHVHYLAVSKIVILYETQQSCKKYFLPILLYVTKKIEQCLYACSLTPFISFVTDRLWFFFDVLSKTTRMLWCSNPLPAFISELAKTLQCELSKNRAPHIERGWWHQVNSVQIYDACTR